MQSPLDDVPKPLDAPTEHTSLKLIPLFTLVMIVFALAYVVIFPNREPPGFSDVQWVERPMLDASKSPPQVGFSILLRSFEKETTSYHVRVQLEGVSAATQNTTLDAQTTKQLDFSIPLSKPLSPQAQVKVLITRPGSDANGSREVLELVAYLPN